MKADSLEKTLMLGKIEGRRRRGLQRMRWLDGITDSVDMGLGNDDGDGGGGDEAHSLIPQTRIMTTMIKAAAERQRENRLWSQTAWVRRPAPPLTGRGKLEVA